MTGPALAVLDVYAVNNDGTWDFLEQVSLTGPRILKQAYKRVGLGSKAMSITYRGIAPTRRPAKPQVHIHCGLGRDGILTFLSLAAPPRAGTPHAAD